MPYLPTQRMCDMAPEYWPEICGDQVDTIEKCCGAPNPRRRSLNVEKCCGAKRKDVMR